MMDTKSLRKYTSIKTCQNPSLAFKTTIIKLKLSEKCNIKGCPENYFK